MGSSDFLEAGLLVRLWLHLQAGAAGHRHDVRVDTLPGSFAVREVRRSQLPAGGGTPFNYWPYRDASHRFRRPFALSSPDGNHTPFATGTDGSNQVSLRPQVACEPVGMRETEDHRHGLRKPHEEVARAIAAMKMTKAMSPISHATRSTMIKPYGSSKLCNILFTRSWLRGSSLTRSSPHVSKAVKRRRAARSPRRGAPVPGCGTIRCHRAV